MKHEDELQTECGSIKAFHSSDRELTVHKTKLITGDAIKNTILLW